MHRTAKNIYIVNLSSSGISTSLLCLPATLVQCLQGGRWDLGLLACKLVPTLQGTNILMSSGTITAIAVDRWLSITQVNDGFPRKMTHTKVALINLSIWLISFTFASPILAFQTLETISLPWTSYSVCVEVWPHQYVKNAFTILILLIQYLLPLVVLPVVHSQVRAVSRSGMILICLSLDPHIPRGQHLLLVRRQETGEREEEEQEVGWRL